jgi:predicted amidohydrolase YtcJ
MQTPMKSSSYEADLVIQDGTVATVDKDFTLEEAVAVTNGKIVYTGSRESVQKYIGRRTRVINVEGGLVLPGLVDAHAHMNSYSQALTSLNITGLDNYEALIQKVEKRVKTLKPGEWITGGRWDQNRWPVKEFPSNDALNEVSPNNPVYLKRVDGNAALVNLKALMIAGINKDTPNPVGGFIHRKDNGEPSGVILNRAMDIIEAKIPADSAEQYEAKLLTAIERAASFGLTGWHEAGVVPWEISIYNKLVQQKKLKLRCYAMLGDERNPEYKGDLHTYFSENRQEDDGSYMFSVRSVKLFFDGALGSRGAAFYHPYADDRLNTGLLRISPEYIEKVARAALGTGMQVCTHAIGIRGNRLCLEAYEKALKDQPKKDHRFRVEHAQFVESQDVQKFIELDILPCMQPTHCTSDMSFVEQRLGPERAKCGYVWRTFLDKRAIIPCGSDFPVESPNPILGIFAAITRTDTEGKPSGGWHPEQRMSIQEAIQGFTIWAAIASFREKVLGSIEVGKFADFTIIDRNILEASPMEILEAQVLYTIVNGRIIYQANNARAIR